jgi:hypothetical protein
LFQDLGYGEVVRLEEDTVWEVVANAALFWGAWYEDGRSGGFNL